MQPHQACSVLTLSTYPRMQPNLLSRRYLPFLAWTSTGLSRLRNSGMICASAGRCARSLTMDCWPSSAWWLLPSLLLCGPALSRASSTDGRSRIHQKEAPRQGIAEGNAQAQPTTPHDQRFDRRTGGVLPWPCHGYVGGGSIACLEQHCQRAHGTRLGIFDVQELQPGCRRSYQRADLTGPEERHPQVGAGSGVGHHAVHAGGRTLHAGRASPRPRRQPDRRIHLQRDRRQPGAACPWRCAGPIQTRGEEAGRRV